MPSTAVFIAVQRLSAISRRCSGPRRYRFCGVRHGPCGHRRPRDCRHARCGSHQASRGHELLVAPRLAESSDGLVPWSERSGRPCRAGPRRSDRLRVRHGRSRRTPRSTLWAVDLRREKSRCLRQDRVRSPRLTILPFQLRDGFCVAGCGVRTHATIDLGLLDPRPRRFRMHAELLADPFERSRPRSRRLPPPSPLPAPSAQRCTSEVLPRSPSFTGSRASDKPGAVHRTHPRRRLPRAALAIIHPHQRQEIPHYRLFEVERALPGQSLGVSMT